MAFLIFLLPFTILIVLTVVLKRPLWQAALASYVTGAALSVYAKGFSAELVLVPFTYAVFIALELALILFGAIFFLNFLRDSGAIEKIQGALNKVTSDMRLQAILLSWLFGSFIEGASGFGTPAMIVAPLLASLGFPLLLAVVLPLMANTTAVTFGAVGTPVIIGFSGIDAAADSGIFAASVNVFAGLFVPVFILYFVVRLNGGSLKKDFRECLPFALLSGFCFLIPYFLLSLFGVEFPSLFGGLIGLFICIASIRFGFLVPDSGKPESGVSLKDMAIAFFPYILLSALLVAGKFLFMNYTYILELWFGVTRRFPLFQPGMAFLTTAFFLYVFSKKFRSVDVKKATLDALNVLPKPFFAILFIASLAQNLLFIGNEFSLIYKATPYLTEGSLLILAIFTGTFGSFAAGSATVSNLLFGTELYTAAIAIGAGGAAVLGMQLIGAGIGNALALQNIAVVQAAVKLEGKEKDILRQLFVPSLIYITVASLVGLSFYFFS
ncbi:MAG: L-lactate permease [Cytophagaceae bacterium]